MPQPLAPPAMRRADDIFFTAVSLVVLCIIVTGFAPSYFLRGAVFAKLPSLLVHLHGAVFSSWIFLFVIQTSLVAAGNVRLHRKLGWFGAVLACLMVLLGIAAPFGTLHRHAELPSFFTPLSFLWDNIIGVVIFGAIVAVAIWKRNNRKVHKRLMVTANIMLLPPALSRIVFVQHHFVLIPAICFGLFGVMLLFDLFTWRKPLLVTILGVVVFFVTSPVSAAFEKTAFAQNVTAWAQNH